MLRQKTGARQQNNKTLLSAKIEASKQDKNTNHAVTLEDIQQLQDILKIKLSATLVLLLHDSLKIKSSATSEAYSFMTALE
jgi:hypothetical protein